MPRDSDIPASYSRAAGAAAVALALNAALFAAKAAAGWWGGSFALLCDAVNNLSDVVLSIGLLVGLRLAGRPPDANHAYGHGKIEPEVTRLLGIAILATAGAIAAGALARLDDRHPAPHPVVLLTAAVSIAVKEGLFRHLRRKGRETGSGALMADAVNHRFDAAATACVLAGSLGILAGGPDLSWLDDVAALCVAGFMIVAAARVAVRASRDLLDEMPPSEVVDAVRRIALGVAGVQAVEKIAGRKMGLHYLVDIHVELPPTMTVRDAHDVARRVRQAIVGQHPAVTNVLVHIEPHEVATAGH